MHQLTIYNLSDPKELLGAIFEHGADPFIIEDEETALDCLSTIQGASMYGEYEDDRTHTPNGGEFSTALYRLGFEQNANVRHIYYFCNGSCGSVCLPADFEI